MFQGDNGPLGDLTKYDGPLGDKALPDDKGVFAPRLPVIRVRDIPSFVVSGGGDREAGIADDYIEASVANLGRVGVAVLGPWRGG